MEEESGLPGKHFHEHPLKWVASPVNDAYEVELEQSLKQSQSMHRTTTNTTARSTLSNTMEKLFRHHAESTPSELFYDLFFVANLTSFTNVHEIRDRASLSSYIGIFSIIWLTWYHVAMFDVRFSRDSVFDRVAKTFQFGVMLGFCVVGSFADEEGGQEGNVQFLKSDGRSLSLILMASRIVLGTQYLVSSTFTRQYKPIRKAMLVLTAAYYVAAVIYFGISFSFNGSSPSVNAYVAWYIIPMAEHLINHIVTWTVPGMSFKRTHLVHRLALLTLIILGEGVIGLFESIQSVRQLPGGTTSDTVGIIIAGTFNLYFLYMLYFDNLPEEHFGRRREELWAVIHFPLHICLILAVEGNRLLAVWNAGLNVANQVVYAVMAIPAGGYFLSQLDAGTVQFQYPSNGTEYWNSTANALYALAETVYLNYSKGLELTTASDTMSLLETINDGAYTPEVQVSVSMFGVLGNLIGTVLRAFGVNPPSGPTSAAIEADPYTALEELSHDYLGFFTLADLIFVYFFIAMGFAVFTQGVLLVISKGKKQRTRKHHLEKLRSHASEGGLSEHEDGVFVWGTYDYVRTGAYFVLGLAMASLAFFDLSAKSLSYPGENFLESAWPVPVVTISLFIAVLIHHMPFEYLGGKFGRGKRRNHGPDHNTNGTKQGYEVGGNIQPYPLESHSQTPNPPLEWQRV